MKNIFLHAATLLKLANKIAHRRIALTCLFLGFFFCAVNAQISTEELPYSWTKGGGDRFIPVEIMSSLDLDAISKEDAINESSGPLPVRFGFPQKVNLSLSNSGDWTTTADGGRLWTMAIYSPDALSINLLYDKFWLPEGAKFFIYSKDKTQHIGAFTSKNNKGNKADNTGFATGLLYSNNIVLEYYEPAGVSDDGIISIAQVISGYRFIYDIVANEKYPSNNLLCHNDINSPEGDNWRNEKNAVAFMVMGGHICTGSLLNTTANDNRPVFLTADHCFASSADVNQWVFYWNYEAPSADLVAKVASNKSTSGANLLAKREATGFMLLDLLENPAMNPQIQTYYLGWERTTTGSENGVVIHHPKGAQKKISIIEKSIVNNPSNICWGGANCLQGNSPANSHWRGTFTNGTGEKGSAGSPLLNQNRRVIGQMHGGAIICPPNASFFFGRLDVSWDGVSSDERLKDWLDPAGLAPIEIDGMDALPVIFGPDVICESGAVFNLSKGKASDWKVSDAFKISASRDGKSATVKKTRHSGQTAVITAIVDGKSYTKDIRSCEIIEQEIIIADADKSEKFDEVTVANWNIVLYPNPTDGFVKIDISGDDIPRGALMELYSASGNPVKKLTNMSFTNSINMYSLPAGIYTLRIIFDKENICIMKIVKE